MILAQQILEMATAAHRNAQEAGGIDYAFGCVGLPVGAEQAPYWL
jgi:hypothetical protein